MKELENLKELYLDEIKKINKKGDLTPADAEAANKALEAIKKIDEICCEQEEMEGYSQSGYSQRRRSYGMNGTSMMPDMSIGMYPRAYPTHYFHDGNGTSMMPYDGYQYGDGMSMNYSDRRGRSATTGRYVSRGYGGYSMHDQAVDSMVNKLEAMLREAPDEETRRAIERCIDKLDR